MRNDPKKLNIGRSLFPFAVFIIILIGLLSLFSHLSKQRRENVARPYIQETNTYIAKNQKGLETIFTELFPTAPCYDGDNTCTKLNQEQITSSISGDLKDFSSTMFLKRGTDQPFMILRLSGYSESLSVYPPEKEQEVIQLLEGHTSEIPWDDYFYQLNGKEIIVPVKDSSGKVIGAIVRGVIE